MSFIGFLSNNQLVAMSDAIRVWDISTGKELRALQLNSPDLSALMGADGAVLTPNGDQLALATRGEKPRVKFLDISTLKEVRSVDLPDKDIDLVVLSFAADGHLQVAAQIEKRVKLFDFNPKASERDLGPTLKDFGTQLKFSRDGRLLASSESQEVKVWEVGTGKELVSFKAPANTSASTDVSAFVAFSEDSKRMATGGLNTPTIIWEADTAKQLMKLNGRTNMAYDVTFSADGNRLVSGGRTVWDLRTGRGLRVSATPTEHVFATTSPDGKLIAGHTPNTGVIDLIEVPGGRRLFQLDANVKPLVVRKVHFSADGSMLVANYGEGWTATQPGPPSPGPRVRVWDVKTGRELRSFYTTTDIIEDARFSGDGRTIAVIGAQGQISLWETASGNKIRDLSSAPSLMPATTVTMNPGSMRNAKRGQIPNMPNLAEIQTMMTNMLGSMTAGTSGRSVTSVVFSPDGRVLATGGVESKSNIDLNAMVNSAMSGGSKSKKQSTPDPDDLMNDFKVEAVGQTQLWDISTGQLITAIKGHAKGVSQVAFSRDGRILASAATDNTIKMYDVKSGRSWAIRHKLIPSISVPTRDSSHLRRKMAALSCGMPIQVNTC
jgi:WD40 repeat protein